MVSGRSKSTPGSSGHVEETVPPRSALELAERERDLRARRADGRWHAADQPHQ